MKQKSGIAGIFSPLGDEEHLALEPDTGVSMESRSQKDGRCSKTEDQIIAVDPADEMMLPIWLMKMTQSAYRDSLEYLLQRDPEAAGLLLGPVQDDLLITHFVPDLDGQASSASFHLHAASLNKTLKRIKPAALDCKGIIHSHPSGICQPSLGDVAYLKDLFGLSANVRAMQFFMPIVCDGRLFPYVFAGGRVWIAEMALV